MPARVEKAIESALAEDPTTIVVYTDGVTVDFYYFARRAQGSLIYVNTVHRPARDGDS